MLAKQNISFYNLSVLDDIVHLIQLGGKFMKKSTIIIAIGIFILLTAFLGMSDEKMYTKQKHFQTVDEVLQQLKDKPLLTIDENGKVSEINDFKECFSQRKRLSDFQFNFAKIEIEKVNPLNEDDKKNMLNEYEKRRLNFSKRRPITMEEPVSLIVNAYYYRSMTLRNIEYEKPQKLKLNLVLVDEGEGFVIDYILDSTYEEGSGNA